MTSVLIGVAGGILVAYAVLLVALWRVGRGGPARGTLREALRLLPDLVRLLRRLAADRSLPRGVRIGLVALLAYLVSPIDLVPDFVPVLGQLDDALVVAVGLRLVVRAAGEEALTRHWPGTPAGLRAVLRLAVPRRRAGGGH